MSVEKKLLQKKMSEQQEVEDQLEGIEGCWTDDEYVVDENDPEVKKLSPQKYDQCVKLSRKHQSLQKDIDGLMDKVGIR